MTPASSAATSSGRARTRERANSARRSGIIPQGIMRLQKTLVGFDFKGDPDGQNLAVFSPLVVPAWHRVSTNCAFDCPTTRPSVRVRSGQVKAPFAILLQAVHRALLSIFGSLAPRLLGSDDPRGGERKLRPHHHGLHEPGDPDRRCE